MQLLSVFDGPLQGYSPYHPQIEAQIPDCCMSCGSALVGHGVYWRSILLCVLVGISVRRFRCRGCGITISLLPSFCVPFKRYGSAVVESCLDAVLHGGQSVKRWHEERLLTDCSTAGSWVRQFRDRSGELLTSGLRRIDVRPPAGFPDQARRLWACLRRWAGGKAVLPAVQPLLWEQEHLLGLFRARL